jgi:hypothetical protein
MDPAAVSHFYKTVTSGEEDHCDIRLEVTQFSAVHHIIEPHSYGTKRQSVVMDQCMSAGV